MSEETSKTLKAWADLGTIPLLCILLAGMIWVQWENNRTTNEILRLHSESQRAILTKQGDRFETISGQLGEIELQLARIADNVKP